MDPTLESEQPESVTEKVEPAEPIDVPPLDVEQPKAAKLRVHRLFVDMPGTIRFQCDVCNYLSFKRVHFTSHYENNHGARLLVNFRCRGCAEFFSDSRSCGVHIRRCELAAHLNEQEESVGRNSSRQKARPRKYSPSPEVERVAEAPTAPAHNAVPITPAAPVATTADFANKDTLDANGNSSQRQPQKRRLQNSTSKTATESVVSTATQVPSIIVKIEEESSSHSSDREASVEKNPLPPPTKVPRTPSSSSASESPEPKKPEPLVQKKETEKRVPKPAASTRNSPPAKSRPADKEVIIPVPRDSDIFKCPYCPKTYQRKDRIVDHAEKDHNRIVVYHFRCSYCSEFYEDSRLCFFHTRTCYKKEAKSQPQPKRKEPERKSTPPKIPAKNAPKPSVRPRNQPIGHLNNTVFENRNAILNGGTQYNHDNLFYQELGRYITKNPSDAQILLKAADQFAIVTREVIRKLGFTAFGRKPNDRSE